MAAGKKIGKKSQASNDFLEPLAPTGVSATNVGTGRAYNNGAATVSFSLPALSPAATSYTVTASTGQTATGASSPITVTGIASTATPTFTVTATNAAGAPVSSALTCDVASAIASAFAVAIAVDCAVDTGFAVSAVLSTFPSPSEVFVTAATSAVVARSAVLAIP